VSASVEEIQRRIDRLFARFEHMNDPELVMLRAVWEAEDPTEREQAWVHVKEIVRARGLDDHMEDARARLRAWINNDPFIGITGGSLMPGYASGLKPGTVRHNCLPPMLDAIAATIAADDLTADEATVLLEPVTSLAPPRSSP
jgi:hypothetical protein